MSVILARSTVLCVASSRCRVASVKHRTTTRYIDGSIQIYQSHQAIIMDNVTGLINFVADEQEEINSLLLAKLFKELHGLALSTLPNESPHPTL